jgi:leucyl aminopeptidase
MMTPQDILKLLDPKNQNLPKISADSSFKKYNLIYIPVFKETVKDVEKSFPELKKLKLKGEAKESFEVVSGKQILKISGKGKMADMTPRKIRKMYGGIYLSAEATKAKKVGVMMHDTEWVTVATMAMLIAALNPSILKPKSEKAETPEIALVCPCFKGKEAALKKAIKEGENTAEAKNLMRVLGAIPPNSLSTEVYAKIIVEVCKKLKIKCKHIPQKDLKKYELLNAVSEGSGHDSQLLWITLPVANSKKNTVVVGKGLCYDSGGVQGKGSYMKTMKEDMAGSASVLGTIMNIVKNKMKLKETTHFLLPLAENMMGASAMRADDVWTAGDGQLVEIIHTDAEGRLVMADAICYAKNNIKNISSVYTIATLTGSCCVALGELYTGVVCNDEGLRKEVVEAGKETGDLCFPGPWDADYDDNNSPIADVANLGEKDRDAGWIKAGFFLSRFVPKNKKTGELEAKFCHFDIAGSIDMKASGGAHRRKGFNSGVGIGYLSKLLSK